MSGKSKQNPRSMNRALRIKYQKRFRAMGLPCHICGRPIHYDEPSDYLHPFSMVIDEVIPVSRAEQFGYSSGREACEDFNNLAPAHWRCNQIKSNRTLEEMKRPEYIKMHTNYTSKKW